MACTPRSRGGKHTSARYLFLGLTNPSGNELTSSAPTNKTFPISGKNLALRALRVAMPTERR